MSGGQVAEGEFNSEAVLALRRDVALANRIVHRVGLVSAFGHVSARIPGSDLFLLPTRASPALAEAGRLLVLDLEGNLVAGEARRTASSGSTPGSTRRGRR